MVRFKGKVWIYFIVIWGCWRKGDFRILEFRKIRGIEYGRLVLRKLDSISFPLTFLFLPLSFSFFYNFLFDVQYLYWWIISKIRLNLISIYVFIFFIYFFISKGLSESISLFLLGSDKICIHFILPNPLVGFYWACYCSFFIWVYLVSTLRND